jgi:hypothetical protein
MPTRFETVEAYIAAQPAQARDMLTALRAAVRAAALREPYPAEVVRQVLDAVVDRTARLARASM